MAETSTVKSIARHLWCAIEKLDQIPLVLEHISLMITNYILP